MAVRRVVAALEQLRGARPLWMSLPTVSSCPLSPSSTTAWSPGTSGFEAVVHGLDAHICFPTWAVFFPLCQELPSLGRLAHSCLLSPRAAFRTPPLPSLPVQQNAPVHPVHITPVLPADQQPSVGWPPLLPHPWGRGPLLPLPCFPSFRSPHPRPLQSFLQPPHSLTTPCTIPVSTLAWLVPRVHGLGG